MALLTSFWVFDVILVCLSVFLTAYLYMTRHFNHWSKKGVFEIPPIPFIGNLSDLLLMRICTAEFLAKLYERGTGQLYVGFYVLDQPALVLRDPEIMKTILIKDFDSFSDRFASAAKSDPIGGSNLFFIKNPAWKDLRHKLSPFFSSAKIKDMSPLLDTIGDDLVTHLNSMNMDGDGQVVDFKEVASKYTTDIIGSCVFGLQANSLNNPEAEFRVETGKMFEFTFKRAVEWLSVLFIPYIVEPLKFKAFSDASTAFLGRVFWEAFNSRIESGERRTDLIDLLIKLKAKQKNSVNPDGFKFEGDNLVSQCALFFAAGLETSSTAIGFMVHELSLHQDVQAKLRHELRTALEENGGRLPYDVIMHQLPYLDKVISETLRKYPSVPFLERKAVRDYTIEKTGLFIKRGTPVYVPLLGLHYDPENFPDPEKFDPERFSEENKRTIRPYTYMPFGEGPHNCIGGRFGLLQVKIGISKIFTKFEVVPCEKTIDPMRFNPKGLIVLGPQDGLYHRVRKLSETALD